MLVPFKGNFKVTSVYGIRTGQYAGFHYGLDIVGLDSKDVIAVQDGVVMSSTRVPYTGQSDKTYEWGNYVKVQHKDGTYAFYCHLASRSVKVGQIVTKGTKIGVMGGTGKFDNSYAKHLHLEIRNAQNKATASCNTPLYTGIPNIIQTINNNEEKKAEDMTREETAIMITEAIRKNNEELLSTIRKEIPKEKVYHYFKDLPEWAKEDINYLTSKGVSIGKSPSDLDLNETELKALCWDAREIRQVK